MSRHGRINPISGIGHLLPATSRSELQRRTPLHRSSRLKSPKPVVVKPKPKPKPKVVKYTVRKGDNLTKIARKYGTSVSALRRANGISGDLIRIGQVLTIPR
jgi:LysM repeat protein